MPRCHALCSSVVCNIFFLVSQLQRQLQRRLILLQGLRLTNCRKTLLKQKKGMYRDCYRFDIFPLVYSAKYSKTFLFLATQLQLAEHQVRGQQLLVQPPNKQS